MIALTHVGLLLESVGDIVYPMQDNNPSSPVNGSRLFPSPTVAGDRDSLCAGVDENAQQGSSQEESTVAPLAPKIPDRTQAVVDALEGLRNWISELQTVGYAENPHPGQAITLIHSAVAKRFCLGNIDRPGFSEVFLGVPPDAIEWFPRLPWFHVAIVRGSSRLNFLCEHIAATDLTLAPFSLSLTASSPSSIQCLLTRKTIKVRQVRPNGHGGFEIGDHVLCAIDVVEAHEEHSIEALKAGKLMTGIKSRSPFSKVSK